MAKVVAARAVALPQRRNSPGFWISPFYSSDQVERIPGLRRASGGRRMGEKPGGSVCVRAAAMPPQAAPCRTAAWRASTPQ
jgi:hypothetical protein